ncbi:MAG: T9SS type A sorting domain-containing protein [Chitinophagaceae bacterium]|nr:T9SS type A sorting domain-containing protein [Chitinophagaceae bacterium]
MLTDLQKLLQKKSFYLLIAAFLCFAGQSQAQIFWTENFTVPGWTMNVPTGVNDLDANFFDISDAEGGGITPNLGAPGSCGVALNGNNTLFVTSTLAGGGAAYNSGGFCGLGICVTTNVRSESPVINCTGKVNITIDFNYIENGDGALDDAVMWYFDGVSWSVLSNMPKTLTGCAGQGLWTSHSVLLPASANNNPNVKIGFGWTNNDDGLGTDPSFAVDDITASTPVGGSLSTDPIAILTYCSCATLNVNYTATAPILAGNVFTAQLSDPSGNFAAPVTIGTLVGNAANGTIACTIPCNTSNGTAYRIRVISSNPPLTGSDNGADITINTTPQVVINHVTVNCVDTLTAIATGGGIGGPANGTKYYITDQAPWGQPDNVNAMNDVFGIGGWTQANFSAVAASIFVPGTQFVFIDGSDANAIAMNTFMTANQALIENWVNAGGRLFLNSAPNQGGNMNWGFGGVTLDYNGGQANVAAVVPGHPIYIGPFVPITTSFSGNNFSHARIVGGGTTSLLEGFGDVVLSSKPWGTGLVMFGGMTTPFYHLPLIEAHNFRRNILSYASGAAIAVAYTYLWQPTGATTQTIVPIVSGIYTVTVSNNGCTGTATVNVNVSPPPTVTANANPASVCPGNTTILTGGGNAVSYSWSGGVVDGVPFAPAATGTYTVTGTGANGCTATSTVTVTVNGNLLISVSATSPGVCAGGPDTLTASGATTYVWQPGGMVGANIIVNPVATTTYTVTGSNGPNCTGSTVFTVMVNGIQSLVITMSGTPCNDTLTAVAVGTGGGGGVPVGDKYYITDVVPWGQPNNVNEMNTVFGAGNWIQANFSTPPATIFVPGTQFVFIEGGDGNGIGCTNYMNANIALIEAWVNAGGRLFLNAAPNNGGVQTWGFGGTSLNYQNLIPVAGNANPAVQMTNMAHPINLGPYLPVDPTGTYSGNYFAHADVVGGGTTVLHDFFNPAISVCSEKTWGTGLVMFGGMTTTNWHNQILPLVNQHAVNLRMNMLFYVAGSPLPVPPITYMWQPGNVAGQVFVPPATGIYTVTATINGCTSTATFNFTLNTPPVMTATAAPATICPGGNVVMTVSGAATYVWQPGGLTGPTQNINPMATTTYTITGTSAAGCTSTTTLTVTVTNNLPVNAIAAPNSICLGGVSTLTASGAVNYNWMPGNLNGAAQNVSPAVTTTYTVTGSDPNGCTGITTVMVSVVQPPNVTITAAPAGPVCIGDPLTLTANGALSYVWTGGIVNGAPYYPVANATYTVTGSNNNGCNATATITVTVVTPQAPNVNIVSSPAPTYVGQFATISAIVPGYVPNYILNWYRNNAFFTSTVSPANSVSYIPNALSDSIYAYMVAVGCYDPDSVRSNGIAPRTPLSLNDVEAPEGFVMYPNPSSNIVNIDGTIAGDEMVLTDVIGQTILRKTFKDSKIETINIEPLASGIYYAKFMRQQKSWVVKVKKE